MKRNTKLKTNELYLLSSESVSKNLYFETEKDIIYANQIINKYIKYIGEVIDYMISPSGWLILIKTNSKETLLSLIKQKPNKSSTIKKAIRKKETGVIISEILRIIISSISRQINRNNNRKGAVVKGNFNRYVLKSLDMVATIIKKMKDGIIEINSQRKKYQVKKSLWWKIEFFRKRSGIVSSKARVKKVEKGLITLAFKDISKHVLRKIFIELNSTHLH